MRAAPILALAILALPSAMPGFATAALADDMLPLRQGIFVDATVSCADASNATAMSFWGDELNVAQEIGHITVVTRNGTAYTVTLSPEPVNGDPGGESYDWAIGVPDRETFVLGDAASGTQTYRWCFDSMPM